MRELERRAFRVYYCRQRPTLPYSSPYSTIGGSRLNFRVRNGNGCDPAPMTTGKLGAWGPTSRGATHKRRITLDVDRPKRSSWPGCARRFKELSADTRGPPRDT